MQLEETKVEYLELIYDLIFVYLIGRNNSLLLMLLFRSQMKINIAVSAIYAFAVFLLLLWRARMKRTN